MLSLKLALRYLKTSGRLSAATTWMAICGVAVGVASLVVSMAVVSGFEKTIQQAVIDWVGHVIVLKQGGTIEPLDELLPRLKETAPEIVAASGFLYREALVAGRGKTSGVTLNGLDEKNMDSVLNIKSRVVRGVYSLGVMSQNLPAAFIGKEIANKLGVEAGQAFTVVIPQPSKIKRSGFDPIVQKFYAAAILDLGKFEYNERVVITSLATLQSLLKENTITGYNIRLQNKEQSKEVASRITSKLGFPYWTKDWYDQSRNLFEAIQIEKAVLFFVLLTIVIAASFHVSSALFVSIMRRYADISILKALGANRLFLLRVFSLQGLLVGVIGTLSGVLLGLLLCYLVMHLPWFAIPADVYKIDRLPIELRFSDMIYTVLASSAVCFLATLLPAWRGAGQNPVEGLRYE